MRDSRVIFAISLAVAVLVHVAAAVYSDVLVARWGGYPLPQPRGEVVSKDPTPTMLPPEVDVPPPPSDTFVFGERAGVGDASNASDGWAAAVADREGTNQAALQRDAPGAGGQAARPPQPASQSLPPTFSPPAPVTPQRTVEAKFEPRGLPGRATKRAQAEEQPQPAVAAAPPPELPQQATVKPASPSPTPQSAPHAAPGRPIEQADRDSDLFAQRTAVDAKAGRMIARNGRGFKFTRPKVNLATYVDSAMISFPVIIDMLVRVDPAGRVQDVTVLRSTGAAGIDRAIVLAMYESSFDVIHDAAGRPVAETQRLPMRFH